MPEPPDHEPPVAMVTIPFKDASGLLAPTTISVPAFAVGAVVIVIKISSETALHVPFPVEVNVKVTLPADISATEGV